MSSCGDCCPVCVEDLQAEDTLRLPGCGHAFHVSCALTFAQYDARCPVCRASPKGVAMREASAATVPATTVVLSWEDISEDVQDEVRLQVRDEMERGRREWVRYRARRRRVLNRHPTLLRMYTELREVREALEGELEEARTVYDRRCREVWRSDEAVRTHRAAAARLRRRELRLSRTLSQELHALVGSEPRVW